LVMNKGLGNGDGIDLRWNPLSNESINTFIPQLKKRGVHVLFTQESEWEAPETQPPSCVIKLQKDGNEINEINVGEAFDIVFTNYSGDIKKVRFLSDELMSHRMVRLIKVLLGQTGMIGIFPKMIGQDIGMLPIKLKHGLLQLPEKKKSGQK